MSINIYGQLGRMGEKPDKLRIELEEIIKRYGIVRIEVHLKNPEYGATENPFDEESSL